MTELDWLTEDEQRVYSDFSTMSRELFNHFDCDLKREVGIPRTYYEVLFVVGEAPSNRMRLTDLARGTRSAPSRITHAVGRLERDGLVTRRASPAVSGGSSRGIGVRHGRGMRGSRTWTGRGFAADVGGGDRAMVRMCSSWSVGTGGSQKDSFVGSDSVDI
ncbi:MarR family winged helix-turn-helix transcriptional regulator [Fodinicola acaciae]|uniref:MarR family winged helix-turn-helix transcriptional regulator n=1 Tax=Fodinicola acaciae TaxID=2681555 RepID=UPI0013D25661|nr:MarR family winged helix-turn-helix transcriptional regulator [Fodinicola acaciae]